MHLKYHFQLRVLLSLEAFVCGILAQISPSQLDRTSSAHWTKCASTTDVNKLRTISLISLKLCGHECELRTNCVGVNYWMRGKVCGLLSSISGLETNVLYGQPCVHAASPVAQNHKCECARNKVCDPESGSCGVKECSVPKVSNATLRGNMNDVGSKVKVDCASGYDVKLPMICEQTGNWSYFVECGCPDPCPALSYATLQPGGAHVGDIRKYKCKPGYTTPEGELQFSVTCLADRKWSTPTTYCGKARDSDVGPIDYVTVECQILKFSTFTANHSDAKSACAPFGNLARIDSAEKHAAIRNHLQKNVYMTGRPPFWTQGNYDVEDEQWKFDDGSPMVYADWSTTHANYYVERCIRMTKGFHWDDTRCLTARDDIKFICELLEP